MTQLFIEEGANVQSNKTGRPAHDRPGNGGGTGGFAGHHSKQHSGIESQSENIRFEKIQGSHGGKPFYSLNETQVTAVKMNREKRFEVKTDLEKEIVVQREGKKVMKARSGSADQVVPASEWIGENGIFSLFHEIFLGNPYPFYI
jgi:hypothetical protein